MALKLFKIIPQICLLQILLGTVKVVVCFTDLEVYTSLREDLIAKEINQRLGREITLNKAEYLVNLKFMVMKNQEILSNISGSGIFPPVHLYPLVKEKIEQSPVYQFIKKMPKGSLLHVHGSAMTSVQWLVDFATYLPHCYLCLSQKTNAYQFVFSKKQPVSTQDCSWKLVANERNKFRGGAKKFDKMLVESIMYSKSEIVSSHKNATRIWQFFEQYFDSVGGLMNYIQVYPVYLTQGLKQLHEDNIQHFEIRSSFKKLYYLSGKRADPRTFIEKFNQGVKQFQEIHCSSCTVRLIISKYRGSSAKKIRHTMSNVAKFQRLYPRLIVGFDLVGHEDAGRTLYHFYPQFKAFNLTFFFHAGETNWQGVSTDENLFDAILLKTKRIGHGLAITKHPVLLEMAKERNIPIEVSPISNQVLGYVSDLRNHPASVLIAKNVSIVVNSDDPATWGSSGLSHDFYALFMGIASMHDDLRLLKKLALDSIRFSSLSQPEKDKFLKSWNEKWHQFIEKEADVIEREMFNR